ncbi:hypothetical protein GTA08_BOTSDO01809 [Neofusicoccum parvum]|uniref:Uncharacterized protein n=1 Tax=Neofusicoccum parvum TaxID=310453 RepID=A0ACB5SLI7_9PEZI|nr:hypothetical protein GTA08_BOTSDO01809 [Neofusicoccum parvum]
MTSKSAQKAQSPWLAITTNLLAAILLAALIALGIYVNLNKLVIGSVHTNGYNVVNLDTTTWNIGCTIVGTAVGLLAAVGFAMQDDYLTRRELAHERGVVALFLRPLTIKRGTEQVYHLQLPFERTLLVLLTIVTALTSASVVALFGIRATADEIINPAGSYPLATLNGTFFESTPDGATLAAGSPVSTPQTALLSGFLYKAAYITGLKMRNKYKPLADFDAPYVPEQGTIGDTIYASLNTRGVGLNVSSYLQYSGVPDGFNMPARYEFDNLQASVFGTHVTVSCQDVSTAYSEQEATVSGLTDVYIKTISKPGGPNITVMGDLSGPNYLLGTLVIASAITLDSRTATPTQTLIVPAFTDGLGPTVVYECAYTGREYLADASVASAVSPLVVSHETSQGPALGPFVQQRLANATHSLVGAGGGNLARGFVDAGYNDDGRNSSGMAAALEAVLGQAAEAYVSLLRQRVERSNLYKGGGSEGEGNGSEVRLYATVLRLGGGSHVAWVAVLGVLLFGAAGGVVRTCSGTHAVDFEAQDAVQLLRSALSNHAIGDKTKVCYRDGIVVVGDDTGQAQRTEGKDGEGNIDKRVQPSAVRER